VAASDYDLASPPLDDRARALWLQHAVGFILFEDVRRHAQERIDPCLDHVAREAAHKAIDDALYGLMMVVDGVTGALGNTTHTVSLDFSVRLAADDVSCETLDLRQDGDGMCMGFHSWREGNFGVDPIID
jgi:hypothetical protein